LVVETLVPAEPDAVWARFVDFPRWPEWNLMCIGASIDGELAPGCRLDLHLRHPRGRGFWTRPRVIAVDARRSITWRASGVGLRSDTRTTFAIDDGGTRVSMSSDAQGFLAFAFRLAMTPATESALYGGMLMSLQGSFTA
jgi:uncharacterized protein YndB with AHSA1/START domain